MIKDRLKYPGVVRVSDIKRFTKGTGIVPVAITEDTGITQEQVCLLKGDYAGIPDFVFRGSAIYYDGQGIDTRIMVACDRFDSLSTLIDNLEVGQSLSEAPSDNVKCGDLCTGKYTCCAVILKQA